MQMDTLTPLQYQYQNPHQLQWIGNTGISFDFALENNQMSVLDQTMMRILNQIPIRLKEMDQIQSEYCLSSIFCLNLKSMDPVKYTDNSLFGERNIFFFSQ
jgi:hypothetical protein